MVCGSSSVKLTEWRERLERFGKSGSTVKQFCSDEGVSAASFYDWRRKLGTEPTGGDCERSIPAENASRVFTPVVLSSAGVPVSIRLPDGVQIEVPSDNLAAVRTVICELVRTAQVSDKGTVSC